MIYYSVHGDIPTEVVCSSYPCHDDGSFKGWPDDVGPNIGDIVHVKAIYKTPQWDFVELEEYQEQSEVFFCGRRIYNCRNFKPVLSTQDLEKMLSCG